MKIQAMWNTYFVAKVLKSVNSVLNLQGGDGKEEGFHQETTHKIQEKLHLVAQYIWFYIY